VGWWVGATYVIDAEMDKKRPYEVKKITYEVES